MVKGLHLPLRHRKEIVALLNKYLPGVEVWVYGSRVNGRSHDGSDLDLVLRGPKLAEIDTSRIADFIEALQDSTIPFLVEARDWARLPESFHHEVEREHVALVGEGESGTASGRRYIPASEFCASVRDGTHDSPKPVERGRKLVTSRHLTTGQLDLSDAYLISEEDFEYINKRSKVDKWDVLISMIGTVGEPCLIKEEPDFAIKNIGLFKTRSEADGKWLYYYFRSKAAQKSIKEQSRGTTQQYIPLGALRDFPILITDDLEEQKTVVHILGTLDDKIELNRRMNETLEAVARALFKSWFVDFDPVRAKMEGRDTGLPKHLADLFPDRFEESELGKIPEGWEVKTLGDLCHKPQYGYTASARDRPIGPKFLRIMDINKRSWIDWVSVPYCEITVDKPDKYRIYKSDILIARMADPGHGIMVEEDQDAVFASYLIRFRPIDKRHARILQYWIRSDGYWDLVRGRSAGTTRVSLNAKDLSGFPLVVPSESLTSKFSKHVSRIRASVVANAAEMQTLTSLRDTLLPKLIAGELRVEGVNGHC